MPAKIVAVLVACAALVWARDAAPVFAGGSAERVSQKLGANDIVHQNQEGTDAKLIFRMRANIRMFDSYRMDSDPTDCAAFQRAHDANPGAAVLLPAREILLSDSEHACSIKISKAVKFKGVGFNEHNLASGTVLRIGNPSTSPFIVSTLAASGFALSDLAITQDQPAPGPGWAPVAYPPVVSVLNVAGQITLDNILAAPVYDLVNSNNSGRLNVTRLRGQIFHNGVVSERSYDSDRYFDWHVWDYWSTDSNVRAWQQTNLDAIRLFRVDTPFIDKIFLIDGRSVIRFSDAGNGTASRFFIGDLQGDGVKHTLWIDGTASHVNGHVQAIDGQHIDNSAPGAHSIANSSTIQIDRGATGNILQIDQLRSEWAAGSVVRNDGDYNTVWMGGAQVDRWGAQGNGDAAFHQPNTGHNQLIVEHVVNTFQISQSFTDATSDIVCYNRTIPGKDERICSQGVISFGSPVAMPNTGFLFGNGAGHPVTTASLKSSIMLGQIPTLTPQNTTVFFAAAAGDADESKILGVVPYGGALRNLFMRSAQAPGPGQFYDFTLRVNGADTPVTCRVSELKNSCSDTTHSAAILAGQVWSIRLKTSENAKSVIPAGAIEFDTP